MAFAEILQGLTVGAAATAGIAVLTETVKCSARKYLSRRRNGERDS